MKAFLFFLGLFIINVSFIAYQSDLDRYVQAQNFLKATAEECAAGASLYYNEEEYSEGKIIFKYEEGIKYTEDLIEKSKKCMPFEKNCKITYTIEFEDDFKGYQRSKNPSVTVSLKVLTKDLFRLPFLKVNQVERKSKYELPDL